jgi:hypothetical protein
VGAALRGIGDERHRADACGGGDGRPVVALFGPTEPRRTGPYGQLDGVLRRTELACVPCMSDRCHHTVPFDCLRGIGVEAVAARWKGGWARMGPPGRSQAAKIRSRFMFKNSERGGYIPHSNDAA